MTQRVQREIAEIKNMLLQMSAQAEDAVRSAILACRKQDVDLAKKVIEQDWDIDNLEVRIDTMVLKTLALQQPMAVDLRFLTSVMEIAEQLERVGDHAVNIAEQVSSLMGELDETAPASPWLADMAGHAIKMLGDSINAFVYGDSDLAYDVRIRDKEVDDLYAQAVDHEIGFMQADRTGIKPGVYHIILALNIERIADLATNIAEDVIFLVEGRLVRHVEEEKAGKQRVSPEEGGAEEKGFCPPSDKRKEPLECLENHAGYVHDCLEVASKAVQAYISGNEQLFEEQVERVSELENAADLIKRNVRAHLPKGIIMPIDKFELFLYLNEQDGIADTAEDLLEWLTYRRIEFPEELRDGINELLRMCLDISGRLKPIIHAARTYFQTGDEAVRVHVKDSIRQLRALEHGADVLEHRLKKKVFSLDQDSSSLFYLVRLVELVGQAADHAESSADILRSMVAR